MCLSECVTDHSLFAITFMIWPSVCDLMNRNNIVTD